MGRVISAAPQDSELLIKVIHCYILCRGYSRYHSQHTTYPPPAWRTGTLTMAFRRLLYSWDPPQEFICHAMQFPKKKAEMRERSHAPPNSLVIVFFLQQCPKVCLELPKC